jgi:hypothetical protein
MLSLFLAVNFNSNPCLVPVLTFNYIVMTRKQQFENSRAKAKATIVAIVEKKIDREIEQMFGRLSRSSSWG